MAMTIAVPREIHAGERRVAATPETVGQLLKLGFAVNVEAGAGLQAAFDDEAYRAAGAQVVSDPRALWSRYRDQSARAGVQCGTCCR
jgi:NAD(P) transhydrogenase subunit alpha